MASWAVLARRIFPSRPSPSQAPGPGTRDRTRSFPKSASHRAKLMLYIVCKIRLSLQTQIFISFKSTTEVEIRLVFTTVRLTGRRFISFNPLSLLLMANLLNRKVHTLFEPKWVKLAFHRVKKVLNLCGKIMVLNEAVMKIDTKLEYVTVNSLASFHPYTTASIL